MKGYRFHQVGFTLIEVIVAVAIFSVLSVGCYKIVNGIVNIQERLVLHSEKVREISNAVRIIESDFRQIVDRKIFDNNGKNMSSYIINSEGYGDSKSIIEFTRQGARNPLFVKRSEIIRIAYGYQEKLDEQDATSFGLSEENNNNKKRGYLLRYVWPVLDRGNDNEPESQLLLTDVSSLDVEYLDDKKNWISEWPPLTQEGTRKSDLPYAVKMKIDSTNAGTIERVFVIRPLLKKN